MSNPLMERQLGLYEFEVTDFRQNDYDMGYYVQTKRPPKVCPKCGVLEPRLTVHAHKQQIVRDIGIQGKRSALIIDRRYYHCRECGSTFAEPLECVSENGKITKRLREYIGLKAANTPFQQLEDEYQISDTTVRKIFLERVASLPDISELETPRVLGIDEICLMKNNYHRKEPWLVIANGDENTIMEMLPDRSKPSVIRLLQSLKDPSAVEVVTMDMWSGYRSAVYEALPNAMVIVDKFHVLKMATEQMDSARKYLYKSAPHGLKKNKALFLKRASKLTPKAVEYRDQWFAEYPKLKKAYELKESLFEMYSCRTRAEAEQYFIDWQKSIPYGDSDFNGWRLLASTIRRCQKEIFNYFDAPASYTRTNAFVEGLNSTIRVIATQGRGYDFEVLRGKVLLTAGRKVVFPKTDFRSMDEITISKLTTGRPLFTIPVSKDYGVPLASIIYAAEHGAYSYK